jgi:hemerythrin-like metal-binding protein
MDGHPTAAQNSPAASQIYREHREVLESLSDVRSAISLGRPKPELAGKLAEFMATVEKHFASEEGLMRSSGYQGAVAHAAEHERLFGQLQSVRQEFAAGAINQGGALALFVEVWTKEHIERVDGRFIDFLNAQAS